MTITPEHNERMAQMTLATVYPHYVYEHATFGTLFDQAQLNPNAHLITGVICGYRIEEIENPLTRKIRYMDKLVDELAQGKKLEKILRTS